MVDSFHGNTFPALNGNTFPGNIFPDLNKCLNQILPVAKPYNSQSITIQRQKLRTDVLRFAIPRVTKCKQLSANSSNQTSLVYIIH